MSGKAESATPSMGNEPVTSIAAGSQTTTLDVCASMT
jgi:hypothetical protein